MRVSTSVVSCDGIERYRRGLSRLVLTLNVLMGIMSAQFVAAQTFTVLHAFTYGTDANQPIGGLTLDAAGDLYGTGASGGAFNYGAIFKLEKSGKETVLQSFDFNDGTSPISALTRDPKGHFYGTAEGGGAGGKCGRSCGTVFQMDSSGETKRLLTFRGGADGWAPSSGVIRDPAGNLYGATNYGGAPNSCGGLGCGLVFKLDGAGNRDLHVSGWIGWRRSVR
jgi:uncharacterized repeat protein (TIGR03803 family)